MKKITLITDVHNGRLKRNRPLIEKTIASFEGKTILITLEKQTRKRSTEQNAYYWGVVLPIARKAFLDTWGEVYSLEDVHTFFKTKLLYVEKTHQETGEIIQLPKSTTENTTTEQEEYHTQIRQFCEEWFNVIIPLPNEDLKLTF